MQRKQVPTRDSHVSSPFKLDGVDGEMGALVLIKEFSAGF